MFKAEEYFQERYPTWRHGPERFLFLQLVYIYIVFSLQHHNVHHEKFVDRTNSFNFIVQKYIFESKKDTRRTRKTAVSNLI